MLGRKHCETQIEVELLFPFQLTSRQSNARGQPPSQGGKDGGSKVSLFGEFQPNGPSNANGGYQGVCGHKAADDNSD
jgi:hypothetical protein